MYLLYFFNQLNVILIFKIRIKDFYCVTYWSSKHILINGWIYINIWEVINKWLLIDLLLMMIQSLKNLFYLWLSYSDAEFRHIYEFF